MAGELEDSIAQFEAVTLGIAAIVEANSIEARKKLISLRQQNLAAVDRLGLLVDHRLNASPQHAAYRTEFHRRFDPMRRAIIMHQAKWPAVLISQDNVGFRDSARELRLVKNEVIKWLRAELLPMVRQSDAA